MYSTPILRVQRGEIYMADLSQNKVESRQGGIRPFLVLSNNKGNNFATIVQGIPLTSQTKAKLPVHVVLGHECGLLENSTALLEQDITIPKSWLKFKIGCCTYEKMQEIEKALLIQKGIDEKLMGLIGAINNIDECIKSRIYMPELNSISQTRSIMIARLKAYCNEKRLDFNLIANNNINNNKNWGVGDVVNA